MKTLLSIIESPLHPDFSALYERQGYELTYVQSMRRAIAWLKRTSVERPVDVVVAEFFYGWGNNYAGVNISNMDVMLWSLQKFAPNAKVIVMVDKRERQYVGKLNEILPLHAVLVHPVSKKQMEAVLA